jgi:hypothetical protein
LAIDPVYHYVSVYGRENAESPYRAYKNAAERTEDGEYTYTANRLPDGIFDFRFDEAKIPPGEGEGDLIFVCCTEETERLRSLGPVFGYVDQEMDIELSGHIIADDFVLMLETTGADGRKSYEPVKSGEPSRNGFLYELLAGNKLCVRNPEIGRDCKAYIASCAVTLGAEGNVREENMFEALSRDGEERSDAFFVNPAPGRGGETPESLANLRGRFSACMKTPWTAVTAADYEAIVLSAPGLCIHKVKALPNPSENLVQIVVKPRGEERFPGLSASYIRRITELLESRRMLAAKFVLVQPLYLPIDVRASIYVRSRSTSARADIERALSEALDFVSSDADFGTPVLFDKVFGAITDLPCVLTITDLSLTPGSRGLSVQNGLDIIPERRCLCYPGKISRAVNARAER